MSDVVPSDPAWKAASDYVGSIQAHMKGEARTLAQAIQVLVNAEREACAKIAEEVARGLVITTDHDRGLSQASTFIAAAIRARGQVTPD
jgi:hypothetical protein